MLIKTRTEKETANDFYSGAGPISRVRYGFFRANRTGVISPYCCEKCVYGTGNHATFCSLNIVSVIEEVPKESSRTAPAP